MDRTPVSREIENNQLITELLTTVQCYQLCKIKQVASSLCFLPLNHQRQMKFYQELNVELNAVTPTLCNCSIFNISEAHCTVNYNSVFKVTICQLLNKFKECKNIFIRRKTQTLHKAYHLYIKYFLLNKL